MMDWTSAKTNARLNFRNIKELDAFGFSYYPLAYHRDLLHGLLTLLDLMIVDFKHVGMTR
ncbi:hypothetical protein BMS3Abin03_02240 [bacterium BMS3Abin03]|nr:hypothetical protein BMS3Abin03_02240 [bacterium BMS3Abin03]